VIEPSTVTHGPAGQRTFMTVYDAGGLPVEELQPGGVVIERQFNALGHLEVETGSDTTTSTGPDDDPDAPSAERRFAHDLVGRQTGVSYPDASGTPIGFVYDDRGLLVDATGPAGQARFYYDGLGRMVDRTDAVGTSTFTYTDRSELDSVSEALTGATLDYDWDAAGQPTGMDSSGAGGVVRPHLDLRRPGPPR
jgi:YD repeat-containing protein